jgi:hypothetical protein
VEPAAAPEPVQSRIIWGNQLEVFMPMSKTKQEKKISKVYKEFQAGKLHSGKGGPIVKNKAQGLAIALSSAGVKPKTKKS